MKTIEQLQEENELLRGVIYEAYQLAGALNASEQALDNLLAAANGEPLPHKTFLPHYSHEDLHDKENAAIKAERDALAAQVSRMSTFIKLSAAKWENCHDVYPTFWNLLRVANETPQQHLREVRAEAGRAGYELGALQWCFNSSEMAVDIEKAANQYADQVRRGEVE